MTGLFPEFYRFLQSDLCPHNVRLGYASAKEKYERCLRFLEVINNNPNSLTGVDANVDDNDFMMYVDALRNVRNLKGMEDFYKGTDGFNFSIKHSDMDPANEGGTWLLNEKKKWLEKEVVKKSLTINGRTGKPYSVNDLVDNETRAVRSKKKASNSNSKKYSMSFSLYNIHVCIFQTNGLAIRLLLDFEAENK